MLKITRPVLGFICLSIVCANCFAADLAWNGRSDYVIVQAARRPGAVTPGGSTC